MSISSFRLMLIVFVSTNLPQICIGQAVNEEWLKRYRNPTFSRNYDIDEDIATVPIEESWNNWSENSSSGDFEDDEYRNPTFSRHYNIDKDIATVPIEEFWNNWSENSGSGDLEDDEYYEKYDHPDHEYNGHLFIGMDNGKSLIPTESTSITQRKTCSRDFVVLDRKTNTEYRQMYKKDSPDFYVVTFPQTQGGLWATPLELCLQTNYTPIRRYCFNNGTWGEIEGKCSDEVLITDITNKLYNANLTTVLNITNNIHPEELRPIDVHFISQTLERASDDENIVNQPENFARIINNLMKIEKNVLKSSQKLFNSTDRILYNFDRFLLKTDTPKFVKLPFLLIHTVNISRGNIGAMILNRKNRENFSSFEVKTIFGEGYRTHLEYTDFEIAIVALRQSYSLRDYINYLYIDHYFVTLFRNDNLFNQERTGNSFNVNSWIISILIPNITTASIFRIQIFKKFKKSERNLNHHCSYWCYGKDNKNQSIKGHWCSNEVLNHLGDLYFCEFNHTAHYALYDSEIAPNTTYKTTEPQPLSCPEESIENLRITFPETQTGSWAISNEICLQANYTPVMRYCFDNATWKEVEVKCSDEVSVTNITNLLHKVLKADPIKALKIALNITDRKIFGEEVKPIDIYFISKILEKASEDTSVSKQPDNFNKIINNIMRVDKDVLQSSQLLFNSTDKILHSLDKLLMKTDEAKFASLPLLLVHTVKTSKEVIGGMIKNDGKVENFTSFQVHSLHHGDYIKQLENENFEIAFLIPPSFTQNHDHYFITLFHNDNLFNQRRNKTDFNVGSWIISILIPDVTKDKTSTIQIYFKEFKPHLNQQCNHWRYGVDETNIPIKGHWRFNNNATKFKEGLYICEINHTTHFGMLVFDSLPDYFILELITIFGSFLSIIGIAIIILTAFTFQNWRKNPSNKVVLNVSLCQLVLIVMFFISDQIREGTYCIIVGILLHYTILAQFCWMLAISYSSYRRLHLVLHYNAENFVIKYCLACWGTPLIIVSATAAVSLKTYDKNDHNENTSNICYPKDIYLQFGILLPVSIILTANMIMFLFIIKTLTYKTYDIRKHTLGKSYAKQKTIFLLMFTMGITWTFGFLSIFTNTIIFLYLFCTTTTCHGFIMFLYYILDSKDTRKMWSKKLQKLLKNKKSKQSNIEDKASPAEKMIKIKKINPLPNSHE